jgi:hypothetical protein
MSTKNENDELKGTSPLTIEKLKTYPGFENLSDEEATDAVRSIKACAQFFFELYVANKKENEKQSS